MNLKMKMLNIFFFLIAFNYLLVAQTDWVKWEAKQVTYEMKIKKYPDKNISGTDLGTNMVAGVRSIYKFLISDLDGDNCPFYPSCSEFFVEAVKETNVLTGTLMFVDRFTRDINFFKGTEHYPIHISGKYFDPAYNYSLNPLKIKFLPSSSIAE